MTGATARLALEPLGHHHAVALVAALGDPAIDAYLDAPAVTTVAAMHARIARLARGPGRPDERWLNAVVRRRADGQVLGRIEATTYAAGWAEIAYLIGVPYQRAGYGREATAWLLGELAARGVRQAWATIAAGNRASIALVTRLGFARQDARPAALDTVAPGDVTYARDL